MVFKFSSSFDYSLLPLSSYQRIFFGGSEAASDRVSIVKLGLPLLAVLRVLCGAVVAIVLCCIVYPLLSVLLWLRGLGCIVHYVQDARSKKSAMERLQANLGEEGDWNIARGHAIKRNKRYMTKNSSEHEFNVDALLKTTTGMTMEDLRYNMTNLKSIRRQRALGASMDVVLKQFPSDDHVRACCQRSFYKPLSFVAVVQGSNAALSRVSKCITSMRCYGLLASSHKSHYPPCRTLSVH